MLKWEAQWIYTVTLHLQGIHHPGHSLNQQGYALPRYPSVRVDGRTNAKKPTKDLNRLLIRDDRMRYDPIGRYKCLGKSSSSLTLNVDSQKALSRSPSLSLYLRRYVPPVKL